MALASRDRLLADRYRVLGRLGAGGMAVVVLAEDERLGRKVAVKRLHAESPVDAGRRFEREAKLGASLNHPNIVAVYDIVTDDEGVLIVMEYVDGRTLRLDMDAGPMRPARAIEVLCGMAAALDHAHAHGVVHRDVKPANVLIAARDGAVKLTDLGIATAAERTNITRSGDVLGTAAYMAPERLDGHAGGPPVDVYATAAVAFEMLSGRKAVTGKTAIEVARRVLEAPPPDLADVVPGTPRGVAEALKRGLAKDPDERQTTVGELVRELSAAYAGAALERPPTAPARGAPAQPRDRSAPDRRRRGWRVPAALAAGAAVVVAIVLVAGSGDGDKTADRAPAPTSKSKKTTDGRGSGGSSGARAAPPPNTVQPAPPPAGGSAAPAPAEGAPTKALTDFYTRAANDDFEGAWALGTDNLHGQFGSIDRFRATVATLQSISFPDLRVTSQNGDSAAVAFSSVAQHTDRVDRCSGQATLIRQASGWLVDHIGVDCATDGARQEQPKRPKKQKAAKH
jgi:eukaryotic-like serine/threonine-protein kinase